MKSDFLVALTQLAAERNLPREVVLSAVEAALVSAYRKDNLTEAQDVSVKLDPGTGEITVYALKTVVDEITDPAQELLLEDALKIKPEVQIGDTVATDSIAHIAGRIAAQTAKQVVMQRLREAERELVFLEYADREGEVFTVNIQRMEPGQLIVDLGRAEAILPASEQVQMERYRPGQKMKILLQSVRRSTKGPELIVSRADSLLLKRLFEVEVPEIYNGAVEIVAIAREPGARSKVAVRARQDGVDPVGSCVGLRGVRIQNIVNEVQGEKIDVVAWINEPAKFIANALSPSQVLRVELNDETQSAAAIVPDRQISLAIGKEGQNARLAAKLTGWNVDIKSDVEAEEPTAEAAEAQVPIAEASLERLELSTRNLNILKKAGINDVAQVIGMTEEELLSISGFGPKSYQELQTRLSDLDLLPQVVAPEVEPVEPEVEEPAEEPQPEAAVAEVEEPVVEEEAVQEPVAEAEQAEAPTEEAPAVEPEPAIAELMPELMPEEPEAVPALETSTSLRDLTEDVWSLRRTTTTEPGQIRFAEDIAGLKGGIMARRGRRRGNNQGGRRRKKAGGRRRS